MSIRKCARAPKRAPMYTLVHRSTDQTSEDKLNTLSGTSGCNIRTLEHIFYMYVSSGSTTCLFYRDLDARLNARWQHDDSR
jgi:hypothetical protein